MGVGGLTESIALPSDRSRLIDSMAQSCAARGYEVTRIEDVVEGAGLTREDFERHFASKEECGIEAVQTILGKTMVAISATYSAESPEMERTLRGVGAMLELFAAEPAMGELAMIGARQMMPPAGSEVYRSAFNTLTAMLALLRDQAEVDPEMPNSAIRAAIGGVEALIRREIAAGRARSLPDALPDLVYGVGVALLGQEAALVLAQRAREAA
jgi:AcrR family transcriptional regulator